MSAELTPHVAALASDEDRSDDSLDVVLELQQAGAQSTGSRAEKIAHQKANFKNVAEPVKAMVVQSGGTVEGEAWINCTIKARVPAKALKRLREIDGVLKIDVPHTISREG